MLQKLTLLKNNLKINLPEEEKLKSKVTKKQL